MYETAIGSPTLLSSPSQSAARSWSFLICTAAIESPTRGYECMYVCMYVCTIDSLNLKLCAILHMQYFKKSIIVVTAFETVILGG